MARAGWERWSATDDARLCTLAATGLNVPEIAMRMGRTMSSVEDAAQRLSLPLETGFLARVRARCELDPEDPGTCWLWSGGLRTDGNPICTIGARRVSLRPEVLRAVGKWRPAYRATCTTCDNKLCVRPEHIKPLTGAQHTQRLYKGGLLGRADHTASKAAANRRVHSRLTWDVVREMRSRRAAGATVDELVTLAPGVSKKTVYEVLSGKRWAEAAPAASVFSWRPAA